MGISKTTMLHIAQHGHFADFPTVEQIKENQSKSFCVSCVLSKLQPRQSHAPARRKATAPLEFLYMDTHGPITPQDLAGNRYFHIIVDSFSSAKWVILTKTKGEISVALPQWVKAVETHISRLYGKPCKVGTFRTDNAPEFSTRELLDYMLAKHGVEHTTPHGST